VKADIKQGCADKSAVSADFVRHCVMDIAGADIINKLKYANFHFISNVIVVKVSCVQKRLARILYKSMVRICFEIYTFHKITDDHFETAFVYKSIEEF